MDFLKANTRFDEECILEWYQSFHKDCPTGKITKEEFVKIYEVYFPHGNSVQFVNNFFRTTDKDNNGYIDFKEFLQTMNIINAGTTLEKLSWAFKVVMDRVNVLEWAKRKKIVQKLIYTESNSTSKFLFHFALGGRKIC